MASRARGLVLLFFDRHSLSLVGAAMIFVALLLAEVTHAFIVRRGAGAPAAFQLRSAP